jgi:hypothetical protein
MIFPVRPLIQNFIVFCINKDKTHAVRKRKNIVKIKIADNLRI